MKTIDDSEQIDDMVSEFHLEGTTAVYYCKVCEEAVSFEVVEHELNVDRTPCELCGSHGVKTATVECDCGGTHEVVINVW